jgi:acyl-CoA synthetase (AMP-forming)/AMP-acid ligase II
MQGYFGRADDTMRALSDGWLDTGDSGFLHDGELYLHGREKDLIVLRGRNYAPQDVEQAAQEATGIRPGCVAAVGIVLDDADGEALFVFVERARDAHVTDEAIRDDVIRQVVERTGLVPEQVIVLTPGTLPRTSSGKIRRAETRRRFIAAALDPPRRMTPLRLAAELIRSRIAMTRARRAR